MDAPEITLAKKSERVGLTTPGKVSARMTSGTTGQGVDERWVATAATWGLLGARTGSSSRGFHSRSAPSMRVAIRARSEASVIQMRCQAFDV